MTVTLRYNPPLRLSDMTVVKMGIEGWVDSSGNKRVNTCCECCRYSARILSGFVYLALLMTESELSDSSLSTLTQQLSESLGVSVDSPTVVDSISSTGGT